MKRGELVPIKIVLELITEDMVAHLEKSEGFLIDGYPRNVNQVSQRRLEFEKYYMCKGKNFSKLGEKKFFLFLFFW